MSLDEHWRTSTRSGTNGDCVEVRYADEHIEVRDSKDPAGGTVRFDAAAWLAFLSAVRSGGLAR
jgi:hypothetical protein